MIARRAALREAAARIDARTPAERDRFTDLVRVAAILTVLLGHWLVAVIVVEDGRLTTTQLLVVAPWTRWATWVMQVMPLFFVVGGRVNAWSLQRHRAEGRPTTMWVRRRSRRLLRPMLWLLAVWVPLVFVLRWIGLSEPVVERASEVAFMPLWFLVVYTVIILLAPVTWWLHRRAGWGVAVVATLLVASVDALTRAGVPVVGVVNHVLVFGLAHQVGYLWADDRVPAARRSMWMTVGGVLAALLLVHGVDYPVSMVGVEGPTRSNAVPPSLALVALTAAQVGLLLAVRRRCEAWLHASEVVWAAVATIGATIITIFLWHMSALVAVASLTHLTGWWPRVVAAGPEWWALRPVWVLLCTAFLVPLVLVFRGAERVGPPAPGGPLVTASGVVATTGGLYLILEGGLYAAERALRVPVAALALVLLGSALLGVTGSGARDTGPG